MIKEEELGPRLFSSFPLPHSTRFPYVMACPTYTYVYVIIEFLFVSINFALLIDTCFDFIF